MCREEAAHVVDAVFAGMSPQSRFMRFHSPVPRIPAALHRKLVDIDGRCRAAVVAEAQGPDGPVPIGIARLAGSGSGTADMAVAVVDAWHRRGVGGQLLTTLGTLAGEIGYVELRGSVLPENAPMLRLARRSFPWLRPWFDGETVQLSVTVGAKMWTITEEDVLADLLG
ncbi:N-acetyltransferase [Actinomycetes bacterium KLBMP 9759]